MASLSTPPPGETSSSFEERLERGELLTFAPCPFALPAGDELTFLLRQRLRNSYHKNISFNPDSDTVTGFRYRTPEQAERLRILLDAFSSGAASWLCRLLPRYAPTLQRDRASFRPEEEATRALRLTARNDLLHLDAFPSRPTRGFRILRLFVNINPTDDRVWLTSETFGRLLEQFGYKVGLPVGDGSGWARRLGQGLLGLFQPGVQERTPYDSFMLRLHHFLKNNSEFQERAPRRFWHFAPGTAWLAFTDTISHAELRGQYALEHSFFIAPHSLAVPEASPPALLERACGLPVLPRAA
jgi:hypothetical protein